MYVSHSLQPEGVPKAVLSLQRHPQNWYSKWAVILQAGAVSVGINWDMKRQVEKSALGL